jgi:plasmid stability protein
MARIKICSPDAHLKRRARVRGAEHGGAIEEGAEDIPRMAVAEKAPPEDLAAAIRSRVDKFGGVEIPLPSREPMREPPRFPSAKNR